MKKRTILALLPILYFLSALFGLIPPTLLGAGIFSRLTATKTTPNVTATAELATPIASSNDYSYTGSYACILEDATYFCSAPDETRSLFILPKTYYVKIVEYRNDYCMIEYLYDDGAAKKLTGYAKTEQLTFVEYVPKRPYLYYIFDAHYYIDGDNREDSAFLDQITISCVYYGDLRIGSKTYCYVLRGNSFGYIPKPSGIYYEENTEYADYLAQNAATSQPTTEEKSQKNDSSPAQIGILIALCLLVPILAALILKPSRHPPYETEE